ncbi:hypothetical protein A6C57_00240 [Fibrella sp. ES10-3-2-2]|nr:hypothetical protein A6C57_00240 [Fibrella sp. ES10-3-2-2]
MNIRPGSEVAALLREAGAKLVRAWKNDWPLFAKDALGVNLDEEQNEILRSVQRNPRTAVASGTARGKDFVAAVCALCFMYLTPSWNAEGELVGNTKVALTAPTDRQVKNIMMPEISRLFNRAKRRGCLLGGRLNAYDIRTDSEEWFLTGFKADEHNHEAWSGFHAVNTMFVVTEASGISDDTFGAIEGNLQGNSRILLVFNPNQTTGYAAKAMKGDRWCKFRLNSMTAPNVLHKKQIIPGQVDYEWVLDKVHNWCMPIQANEVDEAQDDFQFEGQWYRPEDIFRIKVLGRFPKVGEDSLIPQQWVESAQSRWIEYHKTRKISTYTGRLVLGVDVAGQGRDSSVYCPRYDNIVSEFTKTNSGGKADHMAITGRVVSVLKNNPEAIASIDTIGEGAAVYARVVEQDDLDERTISCKYSEAAVTPQGKPLNDLTGQFEFVNMRAYLFWAVRDWLDPKNKTNAMLPPGDKFLEEATEIKWRRQSNGKIIIELKEDIRKRLGRSTDEFDALANTFYPLPVSTGLSASDIANMI